MPTGQEEIKMSSSEIIQGMGMTYQQAMAHFTWSAVEFCANLAVIAYVLAYFGYIRVPKPQGNVTEETVENIGDWKSMVRDAVGVARTIKTAVNAPLDEEGVEPPKQQPKAAQPPQRKR